MRAEEPQQLYLSTSGIVAAVTGAPAPSSSASDEPEFRGVIDDPDGYANLRSRPNARSAIIAKVQKGERLTFQRKTLNEKTREEEYDPWCRLLQPCEDLLNRPVASIRSFGKRRFSQRPDAVPGC